MKLKELGLQRASFNEKQRLVNVIAKEGDIGTRGLLVEFEKGLDCICYIAIDGAIHEMEGAEVEKGVYEVIYPPNLKRGIAQAEIKFYKDDEILSSHMFDIKVKRNLFNLKNGITIVDEVNLADAEVIETTVEYYDEFERVGYPWGRNLFTDSDKGFNSLWGSWETAQIEDTIGIVGDEETNIVTINKRTTGSSNAIYRRYDEFTEGQYYTLSLFARINPLSDAVEGNIALYINKYENIKITREWSRVHITQLVNLMNNTIHIRQRNPEIPVDVALFKLEKGSTATPWTPAPEDLNNLKGVQYNLSTILNKNQHYIIYLDGDCIEDDFIGVWLGNDKFIGYLQDNKITFKTTEQYDDSYIIIKSLSEKGIIYQVRIKEVEN